MGNIGKGVRQWVTWGRVSNAGPSSKNGARSVKTGEVGLEDFERAILRAVAGIERKRSILVGAEKEVVAKHEAGHAIVSTAVQTVIPTAAAVEKLSIIPRSGGALGCARVLCLPACAFLPCRPHPCQCRRPQWWAFPGVTAWLCRRCLPLISPVQGRRLQQWPPKGT